MDLPLALPCQQSVGNTLQGFPYPWIKVCFLLMVEDQATWIQWPTYKRIRGRHIGQRSIFTMTVGHASRGPWWLLGMEVGRPGHVSKPYQTWSNGSRHVTKSKGWRLVTITDRPTNDLHQINPNLTQRLLTLWGHIIEGVRRPTWKLDIGRPTLGVPWRPRNLHLPPASLARGRRS